jgi:hypothetical protein
MRRLPALLLLAALLALAQLAIAVHDGSHALDADHGAGDVCALCLAHGAATAPPPSLPVVALPRPSPTPIVLPATPRPRAVARAHFRSRAPPLTSC